MRKIVTIAVVVIVAFSIIYSVILNVAASAAIGLCLYQPAEEENFCTGSCCAGMGQSSDCCCYISEIPNNTENLFSYESFSKSIYNYICAKHVFDNVNLTELYDINYETRCTPKYIVQKIFRPPKEARTI